MYLTLTKYLAGLTVALTVGIVSSGLLALSPANATQLAQANVVEDVISDIEKTVINRYFGKEIISTNKSKKHKNKKKKKGLPPGLAKKGSLPPGLQKQLDEKGSLPPGLAKRDLPHGLSSLLPRRKNSKYVLVDDDVVLIDILTNQVLDVLENVLQ